MDLFTAFLVGVVVGHWVLLFAIWRAVTKLIKLIDALETEREAISSGTNSRTVDLLEDRSGYERERNKW